MVPSSSDHGTAPPAAPPLPPNSSHHEHRPSPFHFKIAEEESGFWMKFQYSQGAFRQASDPEPPRDLFAPPAGPYFFYGTLMDPGILIEVLKLKEQPTLRPAELIGYSCKTWGQYPALIDGPRGAIVAGAMYEVHSEEHAARLAEYETKAYRTAPCEIRFLDGEEPSKMYGMTFRYSGPKSDLDEGDFRLNTWLQRMGRGVDTTS